MRENTQIVIFVYFFFQFCRQRSADAKIKLRTIGTAAVKLINQMHSRTYSSIWWKTNSIHISLAFPFFLLVFLVLMFVQNHHRFLVHLYSCEKWGHLIEYLKTKMNIIMRLIKSTHLVYHNLIKEGNNDDDEEVGNTISRSSNSDVDQLCQEVNE